MRKRFSACWFIFIVTLVLVLPVTALADLSGSWSVNSTAPAAGCSYSGTANLTQIGLSLTGSVNLSFKGNDCPSPITMPLNCTLSALADSGSCSINSTAPVTGCIYTGTANFTLIGLSFKSLVTLSSKESGCPSPITMPLHFMLLGSPGR